MPFYDYDPRLRFIVGLTADRGDRIDLALGDDGSLTLQPFARTSGLASMLGGELTLFWIGGYGGGVFLPFADSTCGASTYGGGRYLLDTIKGAELGTRSDGQTVLDFNFAYNPSCSYSDRYVCPLSPPGNRLQAAVQAGECCPDERDGHRGWRTALL